MSTMLQAAMCYLHSEKRFLTADRQINQESYSRRFCQWKNELNLQHQGLHVLNKTTGIELSNDWMYMAIVRDPIDRFLSAFVDKCVRWPRGAQCNNCKANMTCFVQQEYRRMMEEGKKNRLERSWEDRHFFAQNWYCDFRSNYDKYNFIHYSNNPKDFDKFLKEFANLLKKRGIPETSIEYIMSQLKGGKTTNSTIQSEARQYFEKLLRSSPYLMEYILRMYHHDFQLFHFKVPVFSFGK
ncbi:hypothetical protein M3Y97_00986400 [Aphelenchoides bicaudatus]|nr:hypothetical protein M3Y97_00986400 [Aphelenchoides bicaudatus]